MDLLVITGKTVFFYFFILISYRLMGKREIGQLGTTDLIVSILIAELVAISIENFNDTILNTIIPISVLVILEILLAFLSIKSKKVRYFLDGRPSLIINEGKINYKEMVKARYSIDDLLFQLRQNSIKSIEEIEYAFLETNGKLSIFPYNILKLKSSYPMALIIDGVIQKETLLIIKKDYNWLLDELRSQSLRIDDVFYAFYKKHKVYVILNKDVNKY
ncbi:MAG: DUF421 domain-containing protein [bacterium]|nr:DUF421 domain-containing protein [bacterium]